MSIKNMDEPMPEGLAAQAVHEEEMDMEALGQEQCKAEIKAGQRYRDEIPLIVKEVEGSCQGEECFHHVGPEPIPSREAVIDIIHRACRLLFPGYFTRRRLDELNVGYYLGQEAVAFFVALPRRVRGPLLPGAPPPPPATGAPGAPHHDGVCPQPDGHRHPPGGAPRGEF